jgi:hypothetical protein
LGELPATPPGLPGPPAAPPKAVTEATPTLGALKIVLPPAALVVIDPTVTGYEVPLVTLTNFLYTTAPAPPPPEEPGVAPQSPPAPIAKTSINPVAAGVKVLLLVNKCTVYCPTL